MIHTGKESTASPVATSPAPSLARIPAAPWMIVIGLFALSAWLGWKAVGPTDL